MRRMHLGALSVVMAGALVVLGLGSQAALASTPGQLDSAFGVQGLALTTFGAGIDAAAAMAVQPDGMYVVAGTHAYPDGTGSTIVDITLARFTTDGQLDATFGDVGTPGKTRLHITGFTSIGGIVVLHDGRIVIASGPYPGGADRLLARFTASGQLDTTFGFGGVLTLTITPWHFSAAAYRSICLAVRPDGELILGDTVTNDSSGGGLTNDLAFFCLTVNGEFDTTFGPNGDGRVRIDVAGNSNDRLSSMALTPDGSIVAGGMLQNFDSMLVRLTPTGARDTSFGTGGVVVESGKYEAMGVVPMANGSILALYSTPLSGWTEVLGRYSASGTPDTTFGSGGYTDLTPYYGNLTAGMTGAVLPAQIALQSDGSIVLAGTKNTGYPTYDDVWVSRLTPAGLLDIGFGNSGVVVTDFGGADDCAAMGVGADDKIVVAGYAISTAPTRSWLPGLEAASVVRAGAVGMGLARYNGSPSPKDAVAPTTTASSNVASDTTSGWVKGIQTVTLTAADNLGGWGVASTFFSMAGVPKATYATPFYVTGEGSNTISFWSVDRAGNREVQHTGYVNIDSKSPTAVATKTIVKAAKAHKGKTLRFKLRITDPLPSCGSATLTVTVATAKGKRMESFKVAKQATNKALTISHRLGKTLARGKYVIRVTSTDVAGNVQAKATSAKLTIL